MVLEDGDTDGFKLLLRRALTEDFPKFWIKWHQRQVPPCHPLVACVLSCLCGNVLCAVVRGEDVVKPSPRHLACWRMRFCFLCSRAARRFCHVRVWFAGRLTKLDSLPLRPSLQRPLAQTAAPGLLKRPPTTTHPHRRVPIVTRRRPLDHAALGRSNLTMRTKLNQTLGVEQIR